MWGVIGNAPKPGLDCPSWLLRALLHLTPSLLLPSSLLFLLLSSCPLPSYLLPSPCSLPSPPPSPSHALSPPLLSPLSRFPYSPFPSALLPSPLLFSPFHCFPCLHLKVEKHKVFLPQLPLSCPTFLDGVVMAINLSPTPQDAQMIRRNPMGSVAQGVCGLDSCYLPPQSRTAPGGEPGLEGGHPGRGSPARDAREDGVRGP